jgi:lipid A 3-O-deacylase
MIRKIGAAAGAVLLFSFSSAARPLDGVFVEAGYGDDSTSLLRAGITYRWRERPLRQGQWRLAGYWEIGAGLWDNFEETTADIGVTPVFRLQRSQFYMEAGIGVHLVHAHISTEGNIALQLGSHAGVGLHSGKYDFGLRLQHLSNAGLSKPNPGNNFFLVRLQYALE